MVQSTTAQSPPSDGKRPKGILKNSNSYQHASPEAARTSPISERPANRPDIGGRGLSEKQITQMNTDINAGGSQRRNSSNPRGSHSRRQSSSDGMQTDDAAEPRLKWDEANLYLNEGQMGGRMKIDEPKTPYAGHYDPAEDEEEMSGINASELVVDELDKAKANQGEGSQRKAKVDDIPDIDLGEPEMTGMERVPSDGERRVIVDADQMDVDGAHHGEDLEGLPQEEQEKHKRFEEMRKRHYEMRNVKDLLGHAEDDE